VTATPAAAADGGRTLDAVRSTTWSAPCEVGCRHPSPRLSETSPAVRRTTVRVAGWHPSGSSGSLAEQSSSTSGESAPPEACLSRRRRLVDRYDGVDQRNEAACSAPLRTPACRPWPPKPLELSPNDSGVVPARSELEVMDRCSAVERPVQCPSVQAEAAAPGPRRRVRSTVSPCSPVTPRPPASCRPAPCLLSSCRDHAAGVGQPSSPSMGESGREITCCG
jgi:hypothetical protein